MLVHQSIRYCSSAHTHTHTNRPGYLWCLSPAYLPPALRVLRSAGRSTEVAGMRGIRVLRRGKMRVGRRTAQEGDMEGECRVIRNLPAGCVVCGAGTSLPAFKGTRGEVVEAGDVDVGAGEFGVG